MPLLIDNELLEGPCNVAALLEYRIGRAYAARQRALAGGSLETEGFLDWLSLCYADAHGMCKKGEFFLEWLVMDE